MASEMVAATNLISLSHWGVHPLEADWLSNGLVNQDGSIERVDLDRPFSMQARMPRRIELPKGFLFYRDGMLD